MHTENLHPCILLLQQGQAQALHTLLNLYHSPLLQFAQKLICDIQVAEDIVAEVFFKLWQKHKDFHSLPATRSFLYISVRNACFNHRSHLQYRTREQKKLLHMYEDSIEMVTDEPARLEQLHLVWEAVNALPPKCRNIMQLSFRDGLSSKEIAVRLHLSVHTVRNHKLRGLSLIKQRLALPKDDTDIPYKRA
ncbi:MAG: sigma-70 family RNA polymerase sigma factor [Chitinophagaceae bacterium]